MKSLTGSYELSKGVKIPCVALPKSVTPARIRENAQAFDFELFPEDVKLIAALKGCVGYSKDPDTREF